MPNRCKEIREVTQEALSRSKYFNEKVYDCRYTPAQKDKDFPSISILTPREKVEVTDKGRKLFERETEMLIILFTKQNEEQEDERDELMENIEFILNNIEHTDFEFEYNGFETDVNTSATCPTIITTISYRCIYNTDELEQIKGNNFNHLSIEVTNG